MFPSLVNCCTLDWFQSWPHDALESVAADNLHVVEMDERTRAACVEMCLYFHRTSEALTSQFWNEQKRHTYVTPTSYLELISLFLGLLDRRRRETAKIRGRYQTGLDKLLQTEAAVKAMQIELQSMQPDLIRTSEETEAKMMDVNLRKEEAQKIREGVHQEEQLATRAAEVAKAIERECASELGEAMPVLRAAEDALDTLTPQDIGELRAFKNPSKVTN
jgi:dynein heavy chain